MSGDISTIFRASKRVSGSPQWVLLDNGRVDLSAPLEIDGVTIEGLVLHGRAHRDHPREEVMLQIDWHQGQRRDSALERIDWRPLHTHHNKGRGPQGHRFIEITGTHQHGFDLNWYPAESRMLSGNLPIAVPVAEGLRSFELLLAFAAQSFRINNLDVVPAPPWQEGLFARRHDD